MPCMLAHYLVAEQARLRLPQGRLARLLAAERDAYVVGAQGPDFLFYSHVWPGRRSRADLAMLVHQHQMDEVFRSLLGQSAALPADQRQVALAFVCGYAAHLCLDAEAHPWTLYWTGDITDGASPDDRAAALRRHNLLESSIDVVLRAERSADPGWLRHQGLLRLRRASTDVVARMFERVFADVYGVSFSAAEGCAALRDMALFYGAMTDRRAPLPRLLYLLAPAVDRDGAGRAQIYPDRPLRAAADLMETRRRWYRPSAPGEPRSSTFREIVADAAAETGRFLHAAAALVDGNAGVDDVVAAVGDRSMITGVPCDDPRPLVAFAPYVELIVQPGRAGAAGPAAHD